ncbi:MAG TPA: hypothetical protein VHS27_18075 [Gaiellales bacterium]|nr:hypothetical protein [Gaiellales bacterium]
MPTDAVEQVDEFAGIAQQEVAVFGGVFREPPHRCLVVEDGLVLPDQEQERQRVGEVDALELRCGVEGEVRVPALDSGRRHVLARLSGSACSHARNAGPFTL